ncbi:MAG: 16S rRNA (adenine(1518)-N(6)/adenine(1519)-N(6))-dimethyltransferase RsmA [Desulfomicrobium escambiense]|nr:16S rRNA (adenine(1518)-N(6)/adenine(1519)-N(6))-dimethyltransferase RsmA [Desulfomicrobium escambiense]
MTKNIIEKIITEANFSPNDTALEIGPGIGFVTEKAAQKVSKIIAVEIDKEAINELIELNLPNLEIFEQDILKTDISALSKEPVKVIANIPYYITTPILVHLLGEIDQQSYKNRQSVKEIILMVQYEVALRLVANEKSPSKDYGLISILTNYWSMPEFICKVPASAFYPAPKVDSALIKLTVREKPAVEINNPALFRQVIQASFGMRREKHKKRFNKRRIFYGSHIKSA